MLPCAIRRRIASGAMSTSSIWSAPRTTSSGTVSRWRTPVIRSTTSLSDSRCWMLSVEMTSMPASSSSSTSCQRFSLREPGALVWAYSSTSTTSGRRRRIGVDVHLLERAAAVGHHLAGDDLEVADLLGGARRARGSRRCRPRRRCPGPPAVTLVEHRVGLADAGRRAEVDAQRAAPSRGVRVSRRSRHGSSSAGSLVEREVEPSTLTPGSPSTPSGRVRRCGRRSSGTTSSSVEAARPRRRAAPGGGRWRPRCAGRGPSPTR